LLARIRVKLALFAQSCRAISTYGHWIALFDQWFAHDCAAFFGSPRRTKRSAIGVVVYRSSDTLAMDDAYVP
jgi:hypothetical protein